MRCPHCAAAPTSVKQTTRPLDEGLDEGDVKRRLRKCRSCDKNFQTFEIHESFFRELQPITASTRRRLTRQPLLVESAKRDKKMSRLNLKR